VCYYFTRRIRAAVALLTKSWTVACGAISGYNVKSGEGYRLANTSLIVMKRILMQGFVRFDDNIAKYHDEHQERVGKWIKEGKIKTVEDITDGIDNAIEGFLGMLQGKNFGKAALKVADVD
jgi:NADPH-dependent curcumin reductase CurA